MFVGDCSVPSPHAQNHPNGSRKVARDLGSQQIWVSVPSAGCSHWLGAHRPSCCGKVWQDPQELAPTKQRCKSHLSGGYRLVGRGAAALPAEDDLLVQAVIRRM